MESLLKSAEFPPSLWIPDYTSQKYPAKRGIIKVPEPLRNAYLKILTARGLLKNASALGDEKSDQGAIGGLDDESIEDHFATRFSGSISRMQLYALDPKGALPTTLDALIKVFSAGRIRLLDIPFGVGASSLSLLSIIAELRKENRLENRPISVHILGGEINAKALDISRDLLAELYPWWKEWNIDVTVESRVWDILDGDSTIDLLDNWMENEVYFDQFAVVGGNFSGFLGSFVAAGKEQRWMHKAAGQLRQIFTRAGKKRAEVFWVEPQTKKAQVFLLPHLCQEIGSATKRLIPAYSGLRLADSLARSCVRDNEEFSVRAAGIQFKPSNQP